MANKFILKSTLVLDILIHSQYTKHKTKLINIYPMIHYNPNLLASLFTPQSTEVFYLDDGEPKIGPIEKVYVTTLVTPMGLASSFNGGILKIIPKN